MIRGVLHECRPWIRMASLRTSCAAELAAEAPTKGDDDAGGSSAMVDDPCWGSAQECSLPHLLRQLKRSRAVRYESDAYIVLDKPPDLRMDGPFPATVHKLLLYWFGRPAPEAPSTPQPAAAEPDPSDEAAWLAYVATQHQHSNRDPYCLRPCHQLDYATSGALLVARHRAAADRARRAFEGRRVTKRYMALLWGHLRLPADWPVLPRAELDRTMAELERGYRATRKRRRKDTWHGYQPPHALFQQWATQWRQRLEDSDRTRRSRGQSLTADEWAAVWKALELGDEEATTLATMTWAQLKAIDKAKIFERAATVYNNLAREKLRTTSDGGTDDTPEHRTELPTFFRVQETVETQTFYIFASLAQDPNDFCMRLPAFLEVLVAASCNVPTAKKDDDTLDFKPSLTECRIVSRSHLRARNIPPPNGEVNSCGPFVTLVSLAPLTGRRHQLRVHAALLGHAVVGDQTYQSKQRDITESSATDRNQLVDRMCLHSARLEIPFLENETDCFRVEAESPFVETEDGIVIRMM